MLICWILPVESCRRTNKCVRAEGECKMIEVARIKEDKETRYIRECYHRGHKTFGRPSTCDGGGVIALDEYS